MGLRVLYIQVTGVLLNGRTNSKSYPNHIQSSKELPDGRRALELS
jgi:hypothetical protein